MPGFIFNLMRLEFSEMWFPFERATEIAWKIAAFFAENDTIITGTFAFSTSPTLAGFTV